MIKPYFYTLKNGLRVIVMNYPHLKSTEISLTVKSGKIYENPEDLGISHFTEHMLFRGTKKYSTEEILRNQQSTIGAYFNGKTSSETVEFSIKALDQYLEKGLEILFEISQQSLLRKKDIPLEKKIILEERKRILDNLEKLVNNYLLPKTIFKDLMLTLPTIGEEKTIKNLNQEKILNFYESFFVPENIILGFNTSLPQEKIIKLVEKYFMKINQHKEGYFQGILQRPRAQKIIFEKRDINQIQIGIGKETFEFNHNKRYTLEILRNVIRLNLFRDLRSRAGLVYHINTYTYFYSKTGSFSICTGIDKKNVKLALNKIFSTLNIIKKSITKEDFKNSKTTLKTNLIFREETPSLYLKEIIYQKLYSEKIETTDDKIKKIDQVKKEDVLEIANRFLNFQDMGFVLVGNLNPKLKKEILNNIKGVNHQE